MYFLIVGSGTEYFKVAAWFSENNPSNARLYSFLPKQEYDRLVSSCDVGMIFLDKRFTIPNYPSRLLSYLENRMPVIVASDANTDIGRIAEENGYGFWSVSGEIEAFDCNVKKVLNSKTVAEMGEKGRRFLEENYTVNKSYSIIIKSMS